MDLSFAPSRQRGTTLIEVLVTMIIIAFGLLGIAALQAKAQVGSIEAYQRAQAVVLLEDLQSRMNGNSAAAASYTGQGELGTGDSQPADCSTLAVRSARDLCEWSAALKGAAEVKAGLNTGAMTGARGCVDVVQAADATAGVCRHAIYLVTVSWQGLHPTIAPAAACGKNKYGDDSNRRAISARVAVGIPSCV